MCHTRIKASEIKFEWDIGLPSPQSAQSMEQGHQKYKQLQGSDEKDGLKRKVPVSLTVHLKIILLFYFFSILPPFISVYSLSVNGTIISQSHWLSNLVIYFSFFFTFNIPSLRTYVLQIWVYNSSSILSNFHTFNYIPDCTSCRLFKLLSVRCPFFSIYLLWCVQIKLSVYLW